MQLSMSPWNGLIGSITVGCWSRLATCRRWNWKSRTISNRKGRPWRPVSHEIVSGIPGAVQWGRFWMGEALSPYFRHRNLQAVWRRVQGDCQQRRPIIKQILDHLENRTKSPQSASHHDPVDPAHVSPNSALSTSPVNGIAIVHDLHHSTFLSQNLFTLHRIYRLNRFSIIVPRQKYWIATHVRRTPRMNNTL